VAAPVFAALAAGPGRSEDFVNGFFEDLGIAIDWALGEAIWRSAGRAFRGYAERRRKHRDPRARRILADFLIGTHAAAHDYRLLTLDERPYRAAFSTLKIETIKSDPAVIFAPDVSSPNFSAHGFTIYSHSI
jgi:hypothetical protein